MPCLVPRRMSTSRPNNVPKFAEKQIAERRRNAKLGVPKESKRTFSAFDEARRKFQETQAQKDALDHNKQERERLVNERKKERKVVGKLIRKRNERGQPNMNSQLELLMKKFR